jgi:hypothetical protein
MDSTTLGFSKMRIVDEPESNPPLGDPALRVGLERDVIFAPAEAALRASQQASSTVLL